MSKNIVFEGWLTKSPPSKRIWRTKWRRRWFALRQSGELPGQYFLDYYADRNCRRLKGTINLDFCEQVDAGLHMERGSHGSLDPKLRGSVFTIQTQTRTYHLEADCEADMACWVDAICRACGLRSTDDDSNSSDIYQYHPATVGNQENIEMRVVNNRPKKKGNNRSVNDLQCNSVLGRSNRQQPRMTNASTMTNDHYGVDETTGPYIPISECITGVRAQDRQNTFNFEQKNIVITNKTSHNNKTKPDNKRRIYMSHPQIRINNVELSENESNFSEDECMSLNTSQSNITGEWTVPKTFTKLSLATQGNNPISQKGPPVPPRPPKTFAMNQRDLLLTHTMVEPAESTVCNKQWLRVPRRSSPGNTPPSPGRSVLVHNVQTDDEDDAPSMGQRKWLRIPQRSSQGNTPPSPGCAVVEVHNVRTDDEDDASTTEVGHYCNLMTIPPAVDRALKPRHTSNTVGTVSTFLPPVVKKEEPKSDELEYLDLDLQPSSNPSTSNSLDKPIIVHGKSLSSDTDSPYKTVDFVKTEAFNVTLQDAEASRNNQQ